MISRFTRQRVCACARLVEEAGAGQGREDENAVDHTTLMWKKFSGVRARSHFFRPASVHDLVHGGGYSARYHMSLRCLTEMMWSGQTLGQADCSWHSQPYMRISISSD